MTDTKDWQAQGSRPHQPAPAPPRKGFDSLTVPVPAGLRFQAMMLMFMIMILLLGVVIGMVFEERLKLEESKAEIISKCPGTFIKQNLNISAITNESYERFDLDHWID